MRTLEPVLREASSEDLVSVVDELTFRSYRHNRRLGITPEGFTRMGFPRVHEMEQRFQLERISQAESLLRQPENPARA